MNTHTEKHGIPHSLLSLVCLQFMASPPAGYSSGLFISVHLPGASPSLDDPAHHLSPAAWQELPRRCPHTADLLHSLLGSQAASLLGKLCMTVLFFPIFPAGFNVRINKAVFVDVFELPRRKALQEVINSLAWIIYS